MSAHVSIFPERFSIYRIQSKAYDYPSPWVLELGDGNLIHLSDELADQMAAALWNRNTKLEQAA